MSSGKNSKRVRIEGVTYGLFFSFLYSLAFPSILFPQGASFQGFEIVISLIGIIAFYYKIMADTETSPRLWCVVGMTLGYYVSIFYWIASPVEPFSGIAFPWNQLIGFLFFIINVTHFIAGDLLIIFFMKKLRQLNMLGPICLAFILTVSEFWGFQFLPHNPSHSLLRSPGTAFWASLGGVPLIAFMLYLVIFISFEIKSFRKRVIFFVLSASVYMTPHFFKTVPATLKVFKLNLVQPLASNLEKRNYEKKSAHDIYREIGRNLILKSGSVFSDIVIWPETSLPINFRGEDFVAEKYPEVFSTKVLNTRNLITGLYLRKDSTSDLVTNTNLHISNNEIKGRYDKNYLKPFAETFPIESLNDMIEKLFGIRYTVKRGSYYPPFQIDGHKFFTTICYEALRPDYLRGVLNRSGDGVSFLVNLANDNWFGLSSEPNMHYFMNQWRSLEFNLPVVRVANGGVSGVIYPWDIDHFKTNYPSVGSFHVDLRVPAPHLSYYQKFGMLPVFFVFSFFVFLYLIVHRIGAKSK